MEVSRTENVEVPEHLDRLVTTLKKKALALFESYIQMGFSDADAEAKTLVSFPYQTNYEALLSRELLDLPVVLDVSGEPLKLTPRQLLVSMMTQLAKETLAEYRAMAPKNKKENFG